MRRKYKIATVVAIAVVAIACVVATKRGNGSERERTPLEPSTEHLGTQQEADASSAQISGEDLEQLFAQDPSFDSSRLSSTFHIYAENHLLYNDSTAPCNQGKEALKDFVERFGKDVAFQKERTKLETPDVVVPVILVSDLTITKPDSNGYFSGWKEVSANDATFCTGWLDAEAEFLYHFQRQANGEWVMVEYLGAS